jgi:opacity protein-like surface antigen
MSDRTTTSRRSSAALFAAFFFFFFFFFFFAGTRPAQAQGFISPFIGYNFGGDAGCPEITNCEDKRADYGVSFGALGSIVGFEAEFGYTKNFFGETSNQTSNVLTFMGNFMLAPKIGPVQPYGLAGLGLIRTSVEVGTSNDENQFGWDLGGGLMVFFGEHVGVRGEVRYYKAFQVLDFINRPNPPVLGLSEKKLEFGRAAIGVVFKF